MITFEQFDQELRQLASTWAANSGVMLMQSDAYCESAAFLTALGLDTVEEKVNHCLNGAISLRDTGNARKFFVLLYASYRMEAQSEGNNDIVKERINECLHVLDNYWSNTRQ